MFVKDKVLHIPYSCPIIPPDLDDLGSIYEGYIENRVGVNLPMGVLKAVYPEHRFTKHQADYIIIYPDWDRNHTRDHELRHALFFLNRAYRKAVTKEWEQLDPLTKEKITKKLLQLGYPEVVHCDEWQAYEKRIP